MKALLVALFLVPVIASSQPVFRSVEWGVTRAAIEALESRDALAPVFDTTFGVTTVSYRFDATDRLAGIDINLAPLTNDTRPTPENATSMLAAMPAVDSLLSRAYGPSTDAGIIRSACAASRVERVVAGCERVASMRRTATLAAEHFVDVVDGHLVHGIALRPVGIASSVSVDARPAVMSLD